MAFSAMTSPRTVLLIGDEALYIYAVTGSSVKQVDAVPWQTDEFEEVVSGLIRKECGGKSVLILNDMTDQHFKGGQRVPRVGMMDQAGVLKRKLQVAFPNYPIRGALAVKAKAKEKKPAAGSSSNIKTMGGLYLFASVPASEQVVRTMDAVRLSMAPIAGFVLLPVESSDMVKTVSEKLAARSRKSARWVIFMGQHQSGALRQVITRDGQLAMTRMTPVPDQDADPQAWAYEVSQEFKATVSYLSRFGYSAEEETDVIVIAGQKNGDVLGKLIEIPCNYSSFTAPEAARLLGMRIGVQEEPRYADSLHVAWAGRKARYILPMDAPDLAKVNGPRKAVAALMLLFLLSGGFLGWRLATGMQAMIAGKNELDMEKGILSQTETEYQQEVARMAALGFDIKMIKAATEAWDGFEKGRAPLLPVLKKIGFALGSDLRLDRLTVESVGQSEKPVRPGGPASKQQAAPSQTSPGQLEAKLSLSFPQTVEMEVGMKAIFDLEKRLQEALPEYSVVITQQIGRPVYTEQLKGVVGPSAQNNKGSAEDYMAELVIRGPKS